MSKARKRKRPEVHRHEKGDVLVAPGPSTLRLSGYELAAVACLLLIGFGFRLAGPSRMSVEHFDEGVYASNIWFGAEFGYEYPQRRLYAPPLLPSLIEWSIIAENIASPSSIRPTSLAIMAASLIAGCLTLVAVWWTARDWFGPAAGRGALALAALSDLHSQYSRTALTESLLVLFLVLGVWAMSKALVRNSFGFAVLAGLLTGLAWWTKYNGWLPLAIGFAAIVISIVVQHRWTRQLGRAVACWAGIAGFAFLVWSPYLWHLQKFGGYAEVAANHKQYVVGIAGWLPGLLRQYANLAHYDTLISCCSIALAAFVSGSDCEQSSASSFFRQRSVKSCSLALVLFAAVVWAGSAVVLFVLACVFLALELLASWSARPAEDRAIGFAWQMTAAWIVGLFLAIPLYHPYPRLTLPWMCGLWLGGAAGLSRILQAKWLRTREDSVSSRRVATAATALAALLIVVAAATGRFSRQPVAWQARTHWEPIARQIVDDVSDRAKHLRENPHEAVVFVYGEPALFFHLNAVGTHAYIPAGDLEFVETQESEIPMYLVAGPHAERTTAFVEEFSRVERQLTPIGEYQYTPSDLVLLNQYAPHELRRNRPITQKVRLYEVARER